MLVALADEEEIDGRHGRVERGEQPEARHQNVAARVTREQDEAADDEQLEAQERQVQAEPVEEHGGYLTPRGAPGEPRDEQEAVGGQEDEVERHQAEGGGGEPHGTRDRPVHRSPKSARTKSARWANDAVPASPQMPMRAKNVQTPAIRRSRTAEPAGAAAGVPRRCCSRRMDT